MIHVSEIGMSRADDVDVLHRGRAEGRVCVTLDTDFHSLLATSGECTPSVIRIRKQGLGATALAALLEGIWPGIEDALDGGSDGHGHWPLSSHPAAAGRQGLEAVAPVARALPP